MIRTIEIPEEPDDISLDSQPNDRRSVVKIVDSSGYWATVKLLADAYGLSIEQYLELVEGSAID